MDEQLLRQLDRRIEEHHACLCQRLDDLAETIRETHAALSARLDAHAAYHAANEHRWGLILLAQRHPFRLAALAVVAWALISSSATDSQWLAQLTRHLLQALFG